MIAPVQPVGGLPAAGATKPRSSLLVNPRFRWYFASEIAGNMGYALYAVAIVWLAAGPGGSYALAGVVLGLEFGIYALSFLVGPLVDRARNLRTVAIVGYAVQAGLAAALGVLSTAHELPIVALLALVIALSVAWDFTWTATNALLPRIVREEEIIVANGLTGSASGGNQVLGAALGGLLIGVAGPGPAMLLYAAMNALALATLLPVVVPDRVGSLSGFLSEFVAGWRFFASGSRPLVELATFGALQGFVSAAPPLLIAVEAQHGFANPAEVYGIFATTFALGGVVGSLLLGIANPKARLGRFLIGTTLTEGGLFLVAALVAPSLVGAVVGWFAIGTAEAVYYTALIAYIQATTPSELFGRTMTNSYLFRGGARSFGALAVGSIVGVLGFVTLGLGIGVALVALALGTFFVLPGVRRLGF